MKRAIIDNVREVCGLVRVVEKNLKDLWWADVVEAAMEGGCES